MPARRECERSIPPNAPVGFIPALAAAYPGQTLDFILDPITRLDIAGAYLRHHLAMDAILFFTVFFAVVHAATARQFKGRASTAIAVAVSAALTVGLLLAESTYRFSLQDFGPVAAAILILTVAVVLFRLVHNLGLGTVGAGALAYAAAYLGARAAMPGLFALATASPPLAILHLFAVVAVVVSVVKAFQAFAGSGDIVLARAAEGLERPVRALKEAAQSEAETRRLDQERDAVRSILDRIVDQPFKDSVGILADLAEIQRAIRRYGTRPEGRRGIAEKLRSIATREHVVLERLKLLQQVNERLRAFDLRLLGRLRTDYEALPEEERQSAKEVFGREVQKLSLEDRIPKVEATFLAYDRQFREGLEHAIAALQLGQPAKAVDWINQCIRQESQAERVMEEIGQIEEQIKILTHIPLSRLKGRGPRQLSLFQE